jgi:hypothetical protein
MKRGSKQNKDEWVYLVLNSETLHFQILDEGMPHPRRHPHWVRVLLRLIALGTKFYGL